MDPRPHNMEPHPAQPPRACPPLPPSARLPASAGALARVLSGDAQPDEEAKVPAATDQPLAKAARRRGAGGPT
eukprot:2520914-Prymnesium_polylepis.1